MPVMRKGLIMAVSLLVLAVANAADKAHRDYVPDQQTAERIAEAVLIAHYGEERVNAGRPLLADGSNRDYWIVQVSGAKTGIPSKGGGPAVWINKYSGCLRVMDYMK
jgi:NTF2 fold immunity protein